MKKNKNIRLQIFILVVGTFLMAAKFVAYALTLSNAILTDALESIINIAAGGFALYSLTLSALPKDKNHPYGHGKIEFISASIEGSLILFAGGLMVFKALFNFFKPVHVGHIDIGIYISLFTGLVNFLLGHFSTVAGKKSNSATLLAGGKHLKSDAYSTAGLVLGLLAVYFTGYYWLDNFLAIVFGCIIAFSGYAILRKSVSGIMDEADYSVLHATIEILNSNRKDNWIDIHNMRIIKYGSWLHIDCHVTLPWYVSVKDAHKEIDEIERRVSNNSDNSIEMFIHTDPCIPVSCGHCLLKDCPVRTSPFKKKLEWTLENVQPDRKHGL